MAAAAHDVLVVTLADLPTNFDACVGAAVTLVEEAYDAALAAIPDGAAKTKGIALGRASAAVIVDLRTGDGSDTLFLDFDYPQGTEPGQWRFTPGTSFAVVPEWGEVTPFALRDSSQYRAPPPHRLTSRRYTSDFQEVKSLGGDGVGTPSARTPSRPRSRCSGWRARRCSGTGSAGRSRCRRSSTPGRTLACSVC